MTKRLLTAVNIGALFAIFIILLREPDGILWALVFLVFIACALLAWWLINRRQRS